MSSSVKFKGAKSKLYNAVKGTLVSSGSLTADTWYKISAIGTSTTAFPTGLVEGAVFKTPYASTVTLESGDAAWPLTLTEVCKVDMEISGEMGVIDTTDSCDYPYNTSIPDGYTSLSGTINTMMRFDEETDELVPVTEVFLQNFFDIVEDDSEGTYTFSAKDDSDLLTMTLLNSDSIAAGKKQTWYIIPIILNSISNNIALKDVLKADYGWTKGQGPAEVYKLTTNDSV